MALREDQLVVLRVARAVEVVAEVLREQHRHEVGGGHGGGRVAGLRRRRPQRTASTRSCWPSSRQRSASFMCHSGGPTHGRSLRTLQPFALMGNVGLMRVAVAFDHRGSSCASAFSRRLGRSATSRRPRHGRPTGTDRLPRQGARARRRRSAPATPSAASSSAARASAPRSPRARSPGSAPRSATTSTPRTRASSTTT